jgi:hypothetical protein
MSKKKPHEDPDTERRIRETIAGAVRHRQRVIRERRERDEQKPKP